MKTDKVKYPKYEGITSDEMVSKMFQEGGIPAIMSTDDEDTKDNQEI